MKALLVASIEHDARKYAADLRQRGYDVVWVDSVEKGRALVRRPHTFTYVSIGGCECSFEEARNGILFRDEPVRSVARKRRRAA